MVKSAVAYVVCPSVSSDAPYALFDEAVGQRGHFFRFFGAYVVFEDVFEVFYFFLYFLYFFFGVLRRVKYCFDYVFSEDRFHSLEEFRRILGMFVYCESESESEFRRVFKEGVAPCGASAFFVYCPRCRGEVASVYGAAACGVGYHCSVSEE